jgi:hypothetical protein
MDVSMMTRMKELKDENRRLRKMVVDERLKAEIITEALAKKWRGHITDVRRPGRQLQKGPSQLRWRVMFLGSARPVIAISTRRMPRTR